MTKRAVRAHLFWVVIAPVSESAERLPAVPLCASQYVMTSCALHSRSFIPAPGRSIACVAPNAASFSQAEKQGPRKLLMGIRRKASASRTFLLYTDTLGMSMKTIRWHWCHLLSRTLRGAVIPAKAGIHFLDTFFFQGLLQGIPAFAGVTAFRAFK